MSDAYLWDQFWKAYPRKVAKIVALRRWARLSTVDRLAALEALPRHIEFWGPEKRYIPHPGTWLNQQRWTDELPEQMPPCTWPGCPRWASTNNGSGQYCPQHLMALKRGETP